jgi:hypothetical protein
MTEDDDRMALILSCMAFAEEYEDYFAAGFAEYKANVESLEEREMPANVADALLMTYLNGAVAGVFVYAQVMASHEPAPDDTKH